MSSSDETTTETESPLLIKSRPVIRKKSLSESVESGSEPEGTADESEAESSDESAIVAKTEKPPKPVSLVAQKPSSAPKARATPRGAGRSKTYERMVHEAMEKLNGSRRIGVSIQRIVSYVNDNNDLPSDRSKFFCKKAIDKGLKENIYVHKSGVGMIGSIVFSADHWYDLKKVQKKALKAQAKKDTSKTKAKRNPKPMVKPKPKATVVKKKKAESKSEKPKPKQDENNNPTVANVAAKKTKTTLYPPVSLPPTKPKAKPKPKPKSENKAAPVTKANKEKLSSETRTKDVPTAKGRQKTAVVTRSKSVDA